MVDYTTPLTTTFELQRQSIKQGQKAFFQTVDAQKRISDAVVDGLDSTESAQRRLVELQQEAVHDTLDAIEANMPGVEEPTEDVRETVDEQFAQLLDGHEEAFDALSGELDDGIATYDEMTDDYVEALEEQVEMLLEAHEELESQSVAAADQLGDQLDELQAQLDEMQAQMQDASEQTLSAVEA